MKLLSFHLNEYTRLGWLQDNGKTVLSPALNDPALPKTMMDMINGGDQARQQLISARDDLDVFEYSQLEILSPVPTEGIFCIGMNYHDHAKEAGATPSEYPVLFLRLPRNHVAHKVPMWIPSASDTLDWEGELVAVIGKGGRHISRDNAMRHVFGYSIYNEGTVRGYLNHTAQLGMGKNFEASGSFGPCVVTADAFGDPYAHSIETRIDGEVVQNGSIDLMIHRIEETIVYLSEGTNLQPGDIICTGTPGGVGGIRKPPRYLKSGELIEVTIDGIGTLSNPIHREPR